MGLRHRRIGWFSSSGERNLPRSLTKWRGAVESLIETLKYLRMDNVRPEPREIPGPPSIRPRHFDVQLP